MNKIAPGATTETIIRKPLFTLTLVATLATLFLSNDVYANVDIDGDIDNDGIIDAIDNDPTIAQPITTFTGSDYTLRILGSGRVANIESTDLFEKAFDGMSGAEMREIVLKVYQHFDDVFDFIIIASKRRDELPYLGSEQGTPYSGIFFDIRNEVEGIGSSIFGNSASHGSGNKLTGVSHIPWVGDFDGVGLHEIMHNWGNYLQSIPSAVGGHWGYSNIGGRLGGWLPNTLESLGNGEYRAQSRPGKFGTWHGAIGQNNSPYSLFELYLMGLIPASEVNHDIRIANDFEWVDRYLSGIFRASSISTVTMDEVISIDGRRSPDYRTAQNAFRALYLTLSPSPLTLKEWRVADEAAYEFSFIGDSNNRRAINFWEATKGTASMQMDKLFNALPATGITEEPPAETSASLFRGIPKFRVGISTDGGATYTNTASVGDSIDIFATIEPETDDIGKDSGITVGVTTPSSDDFIFERGDYIFEKDSGGVFVTREGLTSGFCPPIDSVILAAKNYIDVTTSAFGGPITLTADLVGSYVFHVGYCTTSENGGLTHRTDPVIKLTVTP